DLVVAVLAGLGIGWGLDTLFGTSPWFLLVFMPLGIAAGIANVIRVANSDEARRHMDQMSAKPAPGEKDDKD
ncbi:MAG: AtpZ/AtpI family protein, partial [Pseudomonadota bacterium]